MNLPVAGSPMAIGNWLARTPAAHMATHRSYREFADSETNVHAIGPLNLKNNWGFALDPSSHYPDQHRDAGSHWADGRGEPICLASRAPTSMSAYIRAIAELTRIASVYDVVSYQRHEACSSRPGAQHTSLTTCQRP